MFQPPANARRRFASILPWGCGLAVWLGTSPALPADEPDAPKKVVVSGRAVGEDVPSFYTRAVTGPLMNRSVCYVCRNGQRPVVMVFLRKLGPGVKPLLQGIDRLVDKHRAEGLRSFGVFVSDDPARAISPVQTFSFDHKITLPLTVGSLAVAEPHCQNLHEKADVTVVLYHQRKVVSRFGFREQELTPRHVEEITQSVQRLLKTSLMAQTPNDLP